ncbi:hypothetical protein [Daejeonella oryzae]|uniref:hypothetical protein n=1 Tax=Daejeonella oryzae TaxID=1122943 RepID=UPI00041EA7F1|nr:hypothetical protein [Daejeonella oryzae]
MKISYKYIVIAICIIGLLASCNTLEKASTHGFNSGYYKMKSENKNSQNVYLDITNEQIDVYHHIKKQPDKQIFLTIPLIKTDSLIVNPIIFKKQSLDIDITSIFLKYRPSVYGLPAQLTTDLNTALYTGWRYDSYQIISNKDPLGKNSYKINNRGYDFGVFAGPGTTLISSFSTRNNRSDEYNGMIIQGGIAGFIEFSIASFGFAVGYDYLLSQDRKIWIYNNKPWVGLVVGIALN